MENREVNYVSRASVVGDEMLSQGALLRGAQRQNSRSRFRVQRFSLEYDLLHLLSIDCMSKKKELGLYIRLRSLC